MKNYNETVPVNVEENDEDMKDPQSLKQFNHQLLVEYPISLKFLNRGCIIRVGCKEIAFEDVNNAMRELNDYVVNPYKGKNKWIKILD